RFQALLALTPEDESLYLGLRLAAAHAGRPDLEALASTELAKRADDHRKAAALWERAGLLYQDTLGDPKQAEAAFSAAMGRLPGSPLSFVRLYQLARKAGDRARLVELIDARLETTVHGPAQVELLWEKARYCRALGRPGAAIRALSDLLAQEPQHPQAQPPRAQLH